MYIHTLVYTNKHPWSVQGSLSLKHGGVKYRYLNCVTKWQTGLIFVEYVLLCDDDWPLELSGDEAYPLQVPFTMCLSRDGDYLMYLMCAHAYRLRMCHVLLIPWRFDRETVNERQAVSFCLSAETKKNGCLWIDYASMIVYIFVQRYGHHLPQTWPVAWPSSVALRGGLYFVLRFVYFLCSECMWLFGPIHHPAFLSHLGFSLLYRLCKKLCRRCDMCCHGSGVVECDIIAPKFHIPPFPFI